MQIFPKQYRLLAWLSLLLVVGFLTTNIAGHIVSRDAIQQSIAKHALPLTSDNIYLEIQKDLMRPIFISSLMAQDTFVRDWILNGETDTAQIVRYLKEIKDRYGAVTSFLISERSRKYYYADGVLKTIQENEPRDVWFFRVRKMKEPYETNVDPDLGNRDAITIFINYRMLDYDGNFLAVAGVGLTLDIMTHFIENYEKRFRRDIYFVDGQGKIVLSSKSKSRTQGSIRDLPGIRTIADLILNSNTTPLQTSYQQDQSTVLVNSRYIPELHWYLIIEQNVNDEVKAVQQIFVLNLAISAGVTLLILVLTLFAVKRNQARLEHMATTDALTGLLNRNAFDILFQQAILDVNRSGHPLTALLFDIDFFKRVNDTYGHLAGDRVIEHVAKLAKSLVRENDIVARWGGEEFMMVLRNCSLEAASKVAENLRGTVEQHDFGLVERREPVTISIGLAEYTKKELPKHFFSRADKALYAAKANGRNCVHLSRADETS